MTPAITFFPGVVDTGQKYSKSLKVIASVNDTDEKLKMKKSKNSIYNSKVHPSKLLTKYEKKLHLKIFLFYRRCR
jgi:hypothetical protein